MMKKLFFSLMATCLLMTVFSCGNGSTATQQQMEDRGGSMRLIHVNALVLDIFDLVGFMDVVTVELE